jgi:hypothetical protein
MRFGDSGTGNSTYLEISTGGGDTHINSGSNRPIWLRITGYIWLFNSGGNSDNGVNGLKRISRRQILKLVMRMLRI